MIVIITDNDNNKNMYKMGLYVFSYGEQTFRMVKQAESHSRLVQPTCRRTPLGNRPKCVTVCVLYICSTPWYSVWDIIAHMEEIGMEHRS